MGVLSSRKTKSELIWFHANSHGSGLITIQETTWGFKITTCVPKLSTSLFKVPLLGSLLDSSRSMLKNAVSLY